MKQNEILSCEYRWNGCSIAIKKCLGFYGFSVSCGDVVAGGMGRTYTEAVRYAEARAAHIGSGEDWEVSSADDRIHGARATGS